MGGVSCGKVGAVRWSKDSRVGRVEAAVEDVTASSNTGAALWEWGGCLPLWRCRLLLDKAGLWVSLSRDESGQVFPLQGCTRQLPRCTLRWHPSRIDGKPPAPNRKAGGPARTPVGDAPAVSVPPPPLREKKQRSRHTRRRGKQKWQRCKGRGRRALDGCTVVGEGNRACTRMVYRLIDRARGVRRAGRAENAKENSAAPRRAVHHSEAQNSQQRRPAEKEPQRPNQQCHREIGC